MTTLTPAPPTPPEEAAHEPGLRMALKRELTVQPTQRSFFAKHGELICAITAGILLLVATIFHWTTGLEGPVYYTFVGIAFALGFFFGAAEAWEAIREGKLDIHFLMVVGAVLAIFVGSAMEGAVLLFLFTLSGALEDYAMQRTRAALESLMKLFPKEAIVLLPDGIQKTVPLDQLKLGDRILIKPGENVAADGTVLDGSSAIDESAITGEFMPREKGRGNPVFAGTLNTSGRLVVEVTKPAHDTTLAHIIHLVSQAQEEKAPVERLFDKVGTIYTIIVLLGSVGACLLMGSVFGLEWKTAIYRAITLLIVASPCALIISTPVVILSAIATCARRGIVLKGGRHLESIAALKALVFDKTGTLTTGQVRLVSVEYVDSRAAPLHCDVPGADQRSDEDKSVDDHDHTNVPMSSTLRAELTADVLAVEQLCATTDRKIGCTVLRHGEPDPHRLLLKIAAALEANSTHPLAAAVTRAAKEQSIPIVTVDDFSQEAGMGLRGTVEGELAILGSPNLLHGLCHTLAVNRLCDRAAAAEKEGQTAVVIYYAGLAGLLRFQDTVRDDARKTIDRLHALGIKPLVMLTGDNRSVAQSVGGALGLDEIRSELLPQNKLDHVAELVKTHTVVGMVGDGINDAPALARATVGIAMGTIGSEAAMQAADVVLLSDRIDRLPWLIETARRARTVMKQNLAFAIGVIIVLVTCTSIGKVNMTLGVIGHEGSTVLVVFNGLRLLFAKKE